MNVLFDRILPGIDTMLSSSLNGEAKGKFCQNANVNKNLHLCPSPDHSKPNKTF